MQRPAILAALTLAALSGACTIDEDVETSPGKLTRVHDQVFDCDDAANSPTWACSIEVTVDGPNVSSVGIHNDGSANGPRAIGTLSESALAELDTLITMVPVQQRRSEETGCGFAPPASRNYTIDFASVGLRELSFHNIDEASPELALKNFVTGLLTSIDTCASNDTVSFSACSPRIAPR